MKQASAPAHLPHAPSRSLRHAGNKIIGKLLKYGEFSEISEVALDILDIDAEKTISAFIDDLADYGTKVQLTAMAEMC